MPFRKSLLTSPSLQIKDANHVTVCIQTTATTQNDIILLYLAQRFIHMSHKETQTTDSGSSHHCNCKDSAIDLNDIQNKRQCMCNITLWQSCIHYCSWNATMDSVCVVELHITVDCTKLLSVAQQCFDRKFCHQQQ